ncbi:MAG TPA: oligopeptidase A [Gammaproteobacteria bacterium]|nr:oligopeptidase A [Gammaproteobacteria bacterium]
MTDNILLNMTGLPPFSKIKPNDIIPAVEQVLKESKEQVEQLLAAATVYTWDNLVMPLELIEERISRIWSPVSHMNSVVNSDELRDAYNACLPKLSEYSTQMGQNEALFNAFKQIRESNEFAQLNEAQQKIINNAIRDFRLSGVELGAEDKKRYQEIMQQLSSLTSKYEQNLLDATNAWKKEIKDENLLSGLPDSSKALAKQMAEAEAKDGWLLSLEFPSYYPVMLYADNRQLREEMYTAYSTRASDQGANPDWDNSSIMDEILALRHESANLLGFKNYAERSLATKMAASTDQVLGFLNELVEKSLPVAKKEFAELEAFAKQEYDVDHLEAWDVPYFSEKLREKTYAISQEELKPYFSEDNVLNGLFSVVNRLYGLQIKEVKGVDVWHKDVRFFEIKDEKGELRGQFFLDLYARPNKRGGAWMDDCLTRLVVDDQVQAPVAYLTCNFSPPIGDKPALFTHTEVITMFHEFGHGLHHMLTKVDYPSVSGISGVPWDAVELPSQFMENWCWEKSALDNMAKHYETGEPLPDALFQKMIAAKNFQAGMQMVRQLEFSIFDFRIHAEYSPDKGARIYEILNQVREKVAVVKAPAFNRFAHGFSHIFAGGYAAGYYSYKWAEVLSADAFSLFEEEGVFDQSAGKRFLENILEKGGSKEPMDLFVSFRGREPKIDALLRHSGIQRNVNQ